MRPLFCLEKSRTHFRPQATSGSGPAARRGPAAQAGRAPLSAESPFDSRCPTRESIKTYKKGKTVRKDGLSRELRDLRVALLFSFWLIFAGAKIKRGFRVLRDAT